MRHTDSVARRYQLLTILIACGAASCANAQTINPDFGGCYALRNLGQVPGVPFNYGGIAFKHDDPDLMLIGGNANGFNAAIYSIRVTRDPDGTINGFDGSAQSFASAPQIDGGLAYGPGNVLFYSTYSNNNVGQIMPGSTSPDKVTNMDSVVNPSLGSCQFVPAGFPGAGRFKIASYSANQWADVSISPDGSGTFNLGGVANSLVPSFPMALASALRASSMSSPATPASPPTRSSFPNTAAAPSRATTSTPSAIRSCPPAAN